MSNYYADDHAQQMIPPSTHEDEEMAAGGAYVEGGLPSLPSTPAPESLATTPQLSRSSSSTNTAALIHQQQQQQAATATAATTSNLSTNASNTTSGSDDERKRSLVLRNRRLVLGVCAMDKKSRSKPMTQILDRLRAYGEFDIIIFGDKLILDESISIEQWPLCHALISFASKGFPLQKVMEYVKLRKPFCINDLPSQVVLQNRELIYRILEKHSIPTPRHLYCDRSKTNPDGTPAPEPVLVEYDDYIELDGVRMDKPLVEKPYDGDDHNIYIYYGKKHGGGSRRLFRKVGNRSSRFYPHVNSLRRTGSYIYESLLLCGRDLKVYTIGPGYAHGEMRKCWGAGTKLLMYDGTSKAVEHIKAGDALMGDDGQPRFVQPNTVHSGFSQLFQVQPKEEARVAFTCNEAHVLVLCITQQPKLHEEDGIFVVKEWQLDNEGLPVLKEASKITSHRVTADSYLTERQFHWRPLVFEVDVSTYMSWSASMQNLVQMYQPSSVMEFAVQPAGASLQERLSSILSRPASREECHRAAWELGVSLSESQSFDVSASITLPQLRESYVLNDEPRIPPTLLSDSIEVRQCFFGGLIDGAGRRSTDNKQYYEFNAKHRQIAEDMQHLARGLGFACSALNQVKSASAFNDIYTDWSVRISGDLERAAPWMQSPLKRFFSTSATKSSSSVHSVPFSVSALEMPGMYHGFELDENGRCLLEDFVVTHNSPVVDGVVARDPDLKELRLLTKLTEEEREMARGICVAFKQNICGFDIIRTAEKSYVIDVNGWSFVKGNQRYYDKCARIMRKMILNCALGRDALKLDRPLEFIQIPNQYTVTTPTASSGSSMGMFPPSGSIPDVIQEEKEDTIAVAKDNKPSRGKDGKDKEKEKDKSKSEKVDKFDRQASIQSLPKLECQDSSTNLPESSTTPSHSAASSASSSASAPPTAFAASTTIVPAALNFNQFSLDSPHAALAAGATPLASHLCSASNPHGLGVTMASNVIADSDNNDILLCLVAMFRHADRTPKQKVKLKTKSQTLMQLFDEQMKQQEREREGGSSNDLNKKDGGKTSTKKKKDPGSSSVTSPTPLDSTSSSPAGSPPSSSTAAPGTEKKEKKEPKEFQYKDLKWKKKADLNMIKDAIKILLVKEQLREKRKKKAKAAAEVAAAAAKAAAIEAGEIEEGSNGENGTKAADDSDETSPDSKASNPVQKTMANAAALAAAAAVAAAAAAGDWSDEETELLMAEGASAADSQPLAFDDKLLEAQITAEKAKERKRDAEKDPEYLSKLYQIGQVLEKGYGGIKVQLKPRKVENNKVVQALLIVKWGGEMTHAGVGQARQYAAAFWDDVIAPPYSNSTTNSSGAKPGQQPGGKNLPITSVFHPGTTSALAVMANSNAEEAASTCDVPAINSSSATGAASAAAVAAEKIVSPTVPSTPQQGGSPMSARSAPVIVVTESSPPSEITPTPTNAVDVASSDTLARTSSGTVTAALSPNGTSHEFAYDHNSSLTQNDRTKLKAQLKEARAQGKTANMISSIPENESTPHRSKNNPNAVDATPVASNPAAAIAAVGSSTTTAAASSVPPPSTPVTSSARKPSKIQSNVLSLTSAHSKDATTAISINSEIVGLTSGGAGSSVTNTLSSSASEKSLAISSDSEKLATFRRQRLAFFQGLQVYSSDEARVVASAEAFYTSTFEHAHGLSELTLEQTKDRDEKKKIQSIKEWIEASRKTNISHGKDVQEYLDDTAHEAEKLARAKEGVKYILMADQGLTPAQVTRHMLAQEQIARATSEAERADILKEEEALLKAARAEAEARERDEKEQAVSLRRKQLEEEQMEQLLDRLAELEEDGMNLEHKVALMQQHAKRRFQQQQDIAAGHQTNEVADSDFNFSLSVEIAEAKLKTVPAVISEIEELLSKIYAKFVEGFNKKKKQKAVPVADAAAIALQGQVGGGGSDSNSNTLQVKTPKLTSKPPPTPPSISPPPSPSHYGPTQMTPWSQRCLRWIGRPRNTLMKLYELLLQLQVQIHSKCEWAEQHAEPGKEEDAAAEALASSVTSPAPTSSGSSISTASTSGSSSAVPPSSSTPAPHTRKMSGSNNVTASAAAALNKEAAPAKESSGNKESGKSKESNKASTEFEYVWEEDDVEIAGKSANIRKTQPARFGFGYLLCHKETLFLMKSRWDNLIASFYDPVSNSFDPTKLPDIYDSIKYDVLHNREFLTDIRPLYSAVKKIADFVVPNEYGIMRLDKWNIGIGIARPLLQKMIGKLDAALSPKCPSRVTLFFSSESHIHALRNVLLLSGLPCNQTVATTLDALELTYLSHAVFRLYEDVSKPLDHPLRYYVNIQFSPGASLDPFVFCENDHTLPVSRPFPVAGRVPLHLFKEILSSTQFRAAPPIDLTHYGGF